MCNVINISGSAELKILYKQQIVVVALQCNFYKLNGWTGRWKIKRNKAECLMMIWGQRKKIHKLD